MAQRLEAMEQWAMSGGAFSTVLHRVGTSCGRHAQAGHMTSFMR